MLLLLELALGLAHNCVVNVVFPTPPSVVANVIVFVMCKLRVIDSQKGIIK